MMEQSDDHMAGLPLMAEVDVAVIGGGTAGLIAAKTAREAGKAVVLMEEHRLGGACTWDG